MRNMNALGRSDSLLGHGERGAGLAGEERREPLILLLLGSVAGKDLHVSRVRGGAVACLGRDFDTWTFRISDISRREATGRLVARRKRDKGGGTYNDP